MFIEQGLNLLSENGVLGYIVPNGIIEMPDFVDVRKLLLNRSHNIKIIDLGDDIFEEVNYPCCIFTLLNKTQNHGILLKDLKI